jgi:hypothetical protein
MTGMRRKPGHCFITALAALFGSLWLAMPHAAAQITRCDELAGHPLDPARVVRGVAFPDMRPTDAIAACNAALKKEPANQRLRFELGRALERGGSYAEAVAAYRRAADSGYAAAQMSLGTMYQDGLGITRDDAQAVTWFRNAAERNYALAEDALGTAYRDGRGIEKDPWQASVWFKKAADQGYLPARTKLADLNARVKPREAENTPAPSPAPAPTASAPPAPVVVAIPPVAPSPPQPSPTPAPAPPQIAAVPPAETQAPPPQPAPSQAMPQISAPPRATPDSLPVAPIANTPAPVTAQPAQPPPPEPAPQIAAQTPPTAIPPVAPQPPAEAALPDDPQFKSELGTALSRCIEPEVKTGNYSARDAGKSADLLLGHCQAPWMAWVRDCVNKGNTADSCIRKSALFAQNTIKRYAN